MKTALINIDLQDSFRVQPSWSLISAPDIVARVNRLADHSRAAGDEVIWVFHHAPGSGGYFDPERGYVRALPEISVRPDERMVYKTSHNVFTTTNLAQILVSNGVDRIRLTGIRTEQCVETTARIGSDLGFEVEVVIDATATHPLPLVGGSRILTSDEVIERSAAVLSGRFASITTLAALLGE